MFRLLVLALGICLSVAAEAGSPPDELVFRDFTSYADINPEADFNDQWGRSVALTQGFAFVGSPNTRNPSVNSGVLALFRLPREPGAGWTFEKFIDPPDALGLSSFARSVAASGEWMAVTNGIRCPDSGNSNRGVIHLYRRDLGGSGNWGFHSTLCFDPPADIEGGTLDSSLDMHGDYLIVGNATADVDGESDAGAAVIFERNSGGVDNWGEVASLRRDLPGPQDRLGESVAIYQNVAAVGLPGADLDGENAVGAVLIFERTGGSWNLAQEVRGGDLPQAGDDFGKSVTVWGDTVVAGSGTEETQGSAHVFYRDLNVEGEWGELVELTADTFLNTNFGQAVELQGDELMVGTFGENKVFMFHRDQDGADQWGRTKLLESAESGAERFGESLALLSGFAVVGDSSYDDQPTTESGIGAVTLLFDDIIFRDDYEALEAP